MSISPSVALLASAIWLLAAYLFGRFQQAALSGWMLVVFCVGWWSLAMYMLPGYMLALLPAALLPIGLAGLLLNRTSLVVTAALTVGLLWLLASGALPPAALATPQLPLTEAQFAMVVVSCAAVLLMLMLLPMRTAQIALTRQIADRDAAQARLLQASATIERERDAARVYSQHQVSHLDQVAGKLRDGLIAIDASGNVTHANVMARQIYADITRQPDAVFSLKALESALAASSEGLGQIEIVPLPAQGLAAEASFTHVLIDHREEARFARLRGELLGMLADEMRNPLTSMVTALDLTLGQRNLPEEADRVLIGARQSGQRLLELVTMLLEIGQLEKNPAVLRRSQLALSRVIESGIAQMSPMAQRGAITVSVEHAGESVIAIDSERLQRAFCYLLEQALRQSPPYSVVQVRTRRAEANLVVQIVDQGAGRVAQQSEQIFRKDTRDRSISSLGLIYSKLVIEAHGGRVWAESTGGQGSVYSFSLPVHRQELVAP